MCMTRIFSIALSTTLMMVTLTTFAHGALLIEEEFDYNANTWNLVVGSNNYITTTGLNGGTGFAADSHWGVGLQSGTEGTVSIVDGLSFGTLATSGGALFSHNTSNSAMASRAIGVTVDTGTTLWTSYLWSYTPTERGQTSCSYSQLSDSQFGSTNRWLRILPNQYRSDTRSSISDGSNTHSLTIPALQDGDTYFMVAKNTNLGQSGTGTLWAVAESDFATMAADGEISEADLNTYAVDTVSGNLGSNTMNSGAFLQLAHVWGAGTFDELRIGTALTDVTPLQSVPEPGTVAMLLTGLAAIGFGSIRRKR